jgi:hypothetical protein
LKKKKIQERKELEIVLIRDRGLVEVAEGIQEYWMGAYLAV